MLQAYIDTITNRNGNRTEFLQGLGALGIMGLAGFGALIAFG